MNISRDFRDEKEEIAASQGKSEEKPDPNYRRLQSHAAHPAMTIGPRSSYFTCRRSHFLQPRREAGSHMFQAGAQTRDPGKV